MRRLTGVISMVVLLAPLLVGAGQAEEVLVFAAASLSDALEEVAERYESEHPDRISFHFAASNNLARQIRAGAPAAVFFSASSQQMDALVADRLVDAASRREPIGNALVVIVRREAGATPRNAADLLKLERVAVGDPDTVPAGDYARRFLQAAGVWTPLLPAIVPLRDVRAALAAVVAGHATAGIVYRTDAAQDDRVRVAFAVSDEGLPPIRYSVAATAGASQAAIRFTAFLASHVALEIYDRHGFRRLQ